MKQPVTTKFKDLPLRLKWGGHSVWALVLLLGFGELVAQGQGVALKDNFTNRETLFSTSGSLTGNNATATAEVGEPRIGGKPGGHSLWISWVAPTNGVATFDTHGSGFDTLMSAYTLNNTNINQVNQLHEEARNDDDPAAPPTSLIQIGAIAGHAYEIAIDGFDGATGNVVLNWSFQAVGVPPPIIVSTPNDQAAKQGDPVNLAVNMTGAGGAQFQWYFNGNELTNQSATNYFIPSLQDTNVGRYQLRVTVGNGNNRVRFFTTPVELQINSEGITNSLAEDKLLDAPGSALIGVDDSGSNALHVISKVVRHGLTGVGVVRGYNGSQVFNTTFATTDPNEPPHCGVTGGSSYWLQYQPASGGTLTLDTIGSSYDTVMEVYTYNGTLTSFTNLISVACDNDGVAPAGAARVTFQAVKNRPYVVVVDGVNGAKGTAWMNYGLNTNLPALPPVAASLVVTQTVVSGADLTLAPAVTGAPPLNFVWKRNGTVVPGANTAFLPLGTVGPASTAIYTLTVTNDLGSLTNSNWVHVVNPVNCAAGGAAGQLNLSFPTVAGFRYTIQQTTNLAGPWSTWLLPFTGDGNPYVTNVLMTGNLFLRVKIE
ncbi:MAG TPA: immunoglobulin domain-containing protein [Verrucomicrobiae bacterium]